MKQLKDSTPRYSTLVLSYQVNYTRSDYTVQLQAILVSHAFIHFMFLGQPRIYLCEKENNSSQSPHNDFTIKDLTTIVTIPIFNDNLILSLSMSNYNLFHSL